MRGVNKVILVGNVGKDPETRYTASGTAVTNLSMATSEAWRDKQTGQQQEQTEWHRVVFYGKLAEIVGEFLKKGSKIYLEGSLHTRKWQDKQTGQDKYSTEIKAVTMQMLDSRNSGGGQQQGSSDDFSNGGTFPAYEDFDQQPQQPQQRSQQQNSHAQISRGGGFGNQRQQAPRPNDDFDDDLPF